MTQPKLVALLRAVNVGGQRTVPMAALRELFESLGARDVTTYIQSGNVVYRPGRRALSADVIAGAIGDRFGFAVPVVVREHRALTDVLANNPFLREGIDAAKLHVAFLSGTPDTAAIAKLDVAARSPGDRGTLIGADLYLAFPNGVGRSKVSTEWLDRTLGVTATVRNWRTVEKLAALSA